MIVASKNLRSLSSATASKKMMTTDYLGKNRDPRANLDVNRLENRVRSIEAKKSQE